VDQLFPTIIYEDNNGARLTHHVELKQFAVLQWVEDKQIIFGDIDMAHNISDSLTKQNGGIEFSQHQPRGYSHGTPPTGLRATPHSRTTINI
jgi:hypothetical protein